MLIKINCDSSSFGNLKGADEKASIFNYCNLLEGKILESYPEAKVEFTDSGKTEIIWDMEEYVLYVVDETAGNLFQSMDWVVLPKLSCDNGLTSCSPEEMIAKFSEELIISYMDDTIREEIIYHEEPETFLELLTLYSKRSSIIIG